MKYSLATFHPLIIASTMFILDLVLDVQYTFNEIGFMFLVWFMVGVVSDVIVYIWSKLPFKIIRKNK